MRRCPRRQRTTLVTRANRRFRASDGETSLSTEGPITVSGMAVSTGPAVENRRRRNDTVGRLLDAWMANGPGNNEETWPLLRDAIDREHRKVGVRPRFP